MRTVERRWAENGEDAWGIVENDKFYPMSNAEGIARRVLRECHFKSPWHLQNNGCIADVSYYVLTQPPSGDTPYQIPQPVLEVRTTGRLFREE